MRVFKLIFVAVVAGVVAHCGGESGRETGSSGSALEACLAQWSPTWRQQSGANEWWVELGITGASVAAAHLEVVPTGAVVPLGYQWSKWVGGAGARIATGTQVIAHAETTDGRKAQTRPFAYLVEATPPTDPCVVADAGAGGGGACTNAWSPAWAQAGGANEWWAEYTITGGTVTGARLEVVGVGDVTLTSSWGKWVGGPSFRVPSGTQVVLHATNALGQAADTAPFRYLVDLSPTTKPCAVADAGAGGGSDAGAGGPTTAADVYDPDKVLTYELGFDAAALAVLQDPSTDEAVRKTWVHATFKAGDVTLADVGVRRKGESTYRYLPQKAAFKVRFDKYVKGQTFFGFTDLTLNNSLSDPTFLAERLSYHVFRSVGLPAQRAVSAQVKINGEPYGLYLNVETPNKQLLARLFGANAKTLYEVNWGSEWLPGVEAGFEEDVGDGTLADVEALLTAHAAAKTATLLSDMSGVLDTTEWLRFSATEAAVGHYDGYAFGIWGSHNYFMAGDVNGRFSLIPWSTDLTLSDRQTVVNAAQPLGAGGGPTLLVRCKQSAACWSAYKAQVTSVLTAYEGLGLVALANTWHAQVHPLVLADPKREAPVSYYLSETANLYTWLGARPAVIRAQLF